MSNRLIKIKFHEFYQSFSPILYACLISAVIILGLKLLPIYWMILGLFFVVLFIMTLRQINRRFFDDSVALLKSIIPFKLKK